MNNSLNNYFRSESMSLQKCTPCLLLTLTFKYLPNDWTFGAKISEPKFSGIESSLHRSSETWYRSLARIVVSFLFCGKIPRFFKMGLLDMDFLDDVRRLNPRQVNKYRLKRCQIISRQLIWGAWDQRSTV